MFAARVTDPAERARIERRLAACEGFEPRQSPGPEWIAALAPLPGGAVEPSELGGAGLVFGEGRSRLVDDAPDAAVAVREVVRLVRESPDRLDRLPGDFGFVHLDGDEATVVRSCGGSVPFYVRRVDGGVAIATRLDLLVRLLEGPHEIDPLVLAVNASGWALNPDGRTFLRDVVIVPRGCYARIPQDGPVSIGRYWDPRPAAGTALRPSEDHPRRLRENLIAALERDLDPSGGNAIGLSGGVDSSSVAALAAGALRRPCSAVTLLGPDPGGRATDVRYLDALGERVELHPSRRLVVDPDRWIGLIEGYAGPALQLPHPLLCVVADLAASERIGVLVGGEAADEMCGSALTLADWLDSTSLAGLLRRAPAGLPFGRRTLLRWGKRRAQRLTARIDLPYPARLRGFVHSEVQEEYAEWRSRRLAGARSDERPLLGLALWSEHDGWVAMNWEVTSQLGIRRSLPFYTREAHELAFECHPHELIGPSTKKLLRVALHDDVPHLNLYREDKGGGWGVTGTRPFRKEVPEALGTVVDQRFLAAHRYALETFDVLALTHMVELERRLAAAAGD